MNYKRMWLSLKNAIKENYETYAYIDGRFDEADYMLGEMKFLEAQEMHLEDENENASEHTGGSHEL